MHSLCTRACTSACGLVYVLDVNVAGPVAKWMKENVVSWRHLSSLYHIFITSRWRVSRSISAGSCMGILDERKDANINVKNSLT